MQDSPAGGQNLKTILKKKWKEDAVSPVIATILMVAITVVLAAVLYLLVSGLIGGGGAKPTVSLGQADLGTNTATIDIASVDPTGKALSEFKAILLEGASTASTENGTISPLTNGGSDGALTFVDSDGGGTLSGGDRFTIDTNSGYYYELTIYFGTEKLVSRKFNVP